MAKLLYIESSPRKERSASIDISKTFLEEYEKSHPGDSVEILDSWVNDMVPFDGEVINAKYAILHGESHTDTQVKAWKPVEILIDHFKSVDKYLISLPMWNFGIPYKLKHYIDILLQPGYTFSFSPDEGYKGLVTGKPVTVVYARGGAYQPGSETEGLDFQKKYMELVLGFIGFTDIKSIVAEPMLMATPDEKQKTIDTAKELARSIAAQY
jgi:FMN-dependent NADH-azoreductase